MTLGATQPNTCGGCHQTKGAHGARNHWPITERWRQELAQRPLEELKAMLARALRPIELAKKRIHYSVFENFEDEDAWDASHAYQSVDKGEPVLEYVKTLAHWAQQELPKKKAPAFTALVACTDGGHHCGKRGEWNFFRRDTLFFDSDDAGTPHQLLGIFEELGLTTVYQPSGGATDPTSPTKWHPEIVLAEPIMSPTNNFKSGPGETGNVSRAHMDLVGWYKDAYGFLAAYFSVLAGFQGVGGQCGFDTNTDQITMAMYPGTKRTPGQTWAPEPYLVGGHFGLDMHALLAELGFDAYRAELQAIGSEGGRPSVRSATSGIQITSAAQALRSPSADSQLAKDLVRVLERHLSPIDSGERQIAWRKLARVFHKLELPRPIVLSAVARSSPKRVEMIERDLAALASGHEQRLPGIPKLTEEHRFGTSLLLDLCLVTYSDLLRRDDTRGLLFSELVARVLPSGDRGLEAAQAASEHYLTGGHCPELHEYNSLVSAVQVCGAASLIDCDIHGPGCACVVKRCDRDYCLRCGLWRAERELDLLRAQLKERKIGPFQLIESPGFKTLDEAHAWAKAKPGHMRYFNGRWFYGVRFHQNVPEIYLVGVRAKVTTESMATAAEASTSFTEQGWVRSVSLTDEELLTELHAIRLSRTAAAYGLFVSKSWPQWVELTKVTRRRKKTGVWRKKKSSWPVINWFTRAQLAADSKTSKANQEDGCTPACDRDGHRTYTSFEPRTGVQIAKTRYAPTAKILVHGMKARGVLLPGQRTRYLESQRAAKAKRDDVRLCGRALAGRKRE